MAFKNVITTEDTLRDIIGYPSQRVAEKAVYEIDEMCAAYIAQSPFVLIASADAQGNADISPKGDPAGEFVQVMDSKTLLIPDRPGNRRADTLTNILQNPKVGLFFMVPGRRETLRVTGTAQIVMDEDLLDQFVIKGKRPNLLIAVTVHDAFFHCSKCVIRSNIWEIDDSIGGLSSLAEIVVKQSGLGEKVDDIQAMLTRDEKENLY